MMTNSNENVLSHSHDYCIEIIRCMVGPFNENNLLDCQGLHTVKHPCLKHLSVQQFVKNFHLEVQNSV